MNLAICRGLPDTQERGVWFRAIEPQFWITSLATAQTKIIPSRFNEGAMSNPQFEILYLCENPVVALFEVQAVFGSPLIPGGIVPNPRQAWIIVNVDVTLQHVANLTQLPVQSRLEMSAQELTGDWKAYHQRSVATSVSLPIGAAPTQQLGKALFSTPDLEGFFSISAKLPYHRNLVVFPQKLVRGSKVEFHQPQTGQRYALQP